MPPVKRPVPLAARCFARKMVLCGSLDELVRLVMGSPGEASAMVAAGMDLLDMLDAGEGALPAALPPGVDELTAGAHAVLALLDAVEASYPEGLTLPEGEL